MSEDELTAEQHEWEWVYEDGSISEEETQTNSRKRKASEAFTQGESRRIVGARKGTEELRLGDAVLLKAPRNELWVAIIYEFLEDENEEEKEAKFMWFTSPKDIRNKTKRRNDAMSVRMTRSAEVLRLIVDQSLD